MLLPPIAPDRARRITAAFAGAHVLVVGDAMLDKFIVGRVTRISPEAPVPVVAFDHEMYRMGGSANVANNVAALGGQASLVAVTGQDEGAATLAAACREAGIAPSLVGDASRPTTTKVRIVTDRNQQVARIDYEIESEIGDDVEQLRILVDHFAERGRMREEGVGGDDKPAVPRFQNPQVIEIHHGLGRLRREIQQEHVLAADGALDSGDEHDIPFASVRRQRRGVQLAIVQRDRQRGIPARCRAINQRARVVRNQIDGIFGGMRVEVGFQHIRTVEKSAPRATKTPQRGRSLA